MRVSLRCPATWDLATNLLPLTKSLPVGWVHSGGNWSAFPIRICSLGRHAPLGVDKRLRRGLYSGRVCFREAEDREAGWEDRHVRQCPGVAQVDMTDPAFPPCAPRQRSSAKFLQKEDNFVKQLVVVCRVCVCTDAAKNCLTLLNHCVEGVRGNVPIFEKLWRIRSQANHSHGMTMWSVYLLLLQKIKREKSEYNRATCGSVIRNYRGSASYTEKVARLHASKFGNVQGSVSTFTDLSVALGAAPRHVQRIHFWHLKSTYFLKTRWEPPL